MHTKMIFNVNDIIFNKNNHVENINSKNNEAYTYVNIKYSLQYSFLSLGNGMYARAVRVDHCIQHNMHCTCAMVVE